MGQKEGKAGLFAFCSFGVSCRILSHMCGNWYLPGFPFKEGSFTLINMASLMFLEVPWASLCMMLMHSQFTRWPVELMG